MAAIAARFPDRVQGSFFMPAPKARRIVHTHENIVRPEWPPNGARIPDRIPGLLPRIRLFHHTRQVDQPIAEQRRERAGMPQPLIKTSMASRPSFASAITILQLSVYFSATSPLQSPLQVMLYIYTRER
jgi:hypothetical protein